MKVKFLTILTIIVVIIIGTVSIFMFALTENNGLKVESPTSIKVYTNSLQAKEFKPEDKEYKKLLSLYKQMSNVSYFSILTNNQNLNQKLGQDETCQSGAWTEHNKVNFKCVEFIFENPQRQILKINGNTKRIDFYSIIFKVEENNTPTTIPIYFSSTKEISYLSGTKSYPFMVRVQTKSFFNYLKTI